MFTCAVLAVVLYRAASAVALYRLNHGSMKVALLQLLDVQVVLEVVASHKQGRESDQLLYIQKLEALFEACPQALLQSVQLFRTTVGTAGGGPDGLLIASLFMSLFSLASKVISDDAKVFRREANAVDSCAYWTRFTYRSLEIAGRLLMYTLVAAVCGAAIAVLVVAIDVVLHAYLLVHVGILGHDGLNVLGYLAVVIDLSAVVHKTPPDEYRLARCTWAPAVLRRAGELPPRSGPPPRP